jgi:hypothetical protein
MAAIHGAHLSRRAYDAALALGPAPAERLFLDRRRTAPG